MNFQLAMLVQAVLYHKVNAVALAKYIPVIPQVHNEPDKLDTTDIGQPKHEPGEANLTNVGRQERWYGCYLGDEACSLSCMAQWLEGGYCDGDNNCVCTDQDGDVECPVLALWDCSGVMRAVYNCATIFLPDKIDLLLSPVIPVISLVITASNCGFGLLYVGFYSEACRACAHSYCEALFQESSSWCDEYFNMEYG